MTGKRETSLWSADQENELCAHLATGKTMLECAKAMNMTRSRVAGKICRLKNAQDPRLPANRNLSGPEVLTHRVDRLAELLADGKSFKECAALMDIVPSLVFRYFKRMRKGLGWQAA